MTASFRELPRAFLGFTPIGAQLKLRGLPRLRLIVTPFLPVSALEAQTNCRER
jgi:hypothetical protein